MPLPCLTVLPLLACWPVTGTMFVVREWRWDIPPAIGVPATLAIVVALIGGKIALFGAALWCFYLGNFWWGVLLLLLSMLIRINVSWNRH